MHNLDAVTHAAQRSRDATAASSTLSVQLCTAIKGTLRVTAASKANASAASLICEPSMPTTTGPASDGRSPRTTTTGHSARAASPIATEPTSRAVNPPRPRSPRTTSPARLDAATSSGTGKPTGRDHPARLRGATIRRRHHVAPSIGQPVAPSAAFPARPAVSSPMVLSTLVSVRQAGTGARLASRRLWPVWVRPRPAVAARSNGRVRGAGRGGHAGSDLRQAARKRQSTSTPYGNGS
jgi:hypothetical protein